MKYHAIENYNIYILLSSFKKYFPLFFMDFFVIRKEKKANYFMPIAVDLFLTTLHYCFSLKYELNNLQYLMF